MEEKPLTPHAAPGEDENDKGIRPRFLQDFLGQKELKENLSIFITAARERNEPLDHVFISGPPGLGKTTLANIMANELGADIKVTSAPALDKPKDLAGLLSTIPEKTRPFPRQYLLVFWAYQKQIHPPCLLETLSSK